jgi:hypothetical protein
MYKFRPFWKSIEAADITNSIIFVLIAPSLTNILMPCYWCANLFISYDQANVYQ